MERPLTQHIRPGERPLTLREYEEKGGYEAARKAFNRMTPDEIISWVDDAHLRGRGGAGFPAARKWRFIPKGKDVPRPKYLVVNADEMEPGTFKDRLLMEGNPHQLIEAILISAYAVEADIAYIFLRNAYALPARLLREAIAEAYANRYLGRNILGTDFSLELYLHMSAGRYICGEGTAMLNALEGRRATPRSKPPFSPVVGLWGKPTALNNVETICNIPHIIRHGADWFRRLSHTPNGGTKIYGVSGRVKQPGGWELPMGTTIREIIEEHAGGMQAGFTFRGVLPGGASTDFLVEEHLDVPMDFDTVPAAGSRLGTGTMVILDDRTCPVGLVLNLMRFFAQESCGWCTPCREGLPWTARVLEAIESGRGTVEDLDRLRLHTQTIKMGHTFCALAPGAMEPLQSALRYFEDDFKRHIRDKRCPWR
jgi:NADH-quinone oxidoreductase subunit F